MKRQPRSKDKMNKVLPALRMQVVAVATKTQFSPHLTSKAICRSFFKLRKKSGRVSRVTSSGIFAENQALMTTRRHCCHLSRLKSLKNAWSLVLTCPTHG